MRQLLTLVACDLRQRLRDGSVVVFSLVVPLALIAVLNLTFGGMEDPELGRVRLVTSVPVGDEMATTLLDAVVDSGAVEVRVREVPADRVRRAVERGDADLGIVVPEGFGERVRAGERVSVRAIEGDDAGLERAIVLTVLETVLQRFADGAVVARAGIDAGLDPATVGDVAERAAIAPSTIRVDEGVAAKEQLPASGALVAGQAGLFLLFTAGFGVLSLLTEREQGTLARLRSMPMRPGLVVASKAVVSFVLGVVATSVILTVGVVAFGVSFGSVVVVAALVLGAAAAATSLMFVVARLARTAEQAGMLQSIVSLVLGIAGGAFVSISASGLLGRILDLNPVSAFVRGLGISNGGGGLADVRGELAVMAGFALIAIVVSRLVPDRGGAA